MPPRITSPRFDSRGPVPKRPKIFTASFLKVPGSIPALNAPTPFPVRGSRVQKSPVLPWFQAR